MRTIMAEKGARKGSCATITVQRQAIHRVLQDWRDKKRQIPADYRQNAVWRGRNSARSAVISAIERIGDKNYGKRVPQHEFTKTVTE